MIHTREGDFSIFRQKHKERVAKNPARLEYALEKLSEYNVSSVNQETTQIVVEGFVFYAGTGKITGHSERGIESLIRLLEAKHGR